MRITMVEIEAVVSYVYGRVAVLCRRRGEEGSAVEKVILTAVFAVLALLIGAIIAAKVTAKANSINLN